MSRIAIHKTNNSFSDRWVAYCQAKQIDYKIVDCYRNDIIEQLQDCDALMWHFYHASAKDSLFARQLLYSLQQSGKIVFPDFNTMWHFDDKVGQKYLLESIDAPLVPSYVFYNEQAAYEWIERTQFPKVFKLRGGAGSVNVQLIQNKQKAKRIVKQAFGRGFKHTSLVSLHDTYQKYQQGKLPAFDLTKRIARCFIPTQYSKIHGKERGYVYFQDFIPNNAFDIRVIVIGNKAFAIKRMVRKNDFRASGSGMILYDKQEFDERCVSIAFEVNNRLQSQSIAYDFVFDVNHDPLIVEISYGFSIEGYDPCTGYWTSDMAWHEGKFNPYGWMVEDLSFAVKENLQYNLQKTNNTFLLNE
ncbi:ATP-grasp domain-containing protein [Microbacter margulisiae]|uniref:Glutathione synthase/RimK-type ligase-like ATP-grasp enzyme n=1 Tax=Microbacter margulisiae TaxID=1350067 RepID=A0A7W5DNF6_9PORP|nr:hypothetical protein [Microbacter margulisiae]MBB3185986.1 glutathione synthase/RimK-type ligase-like ATP-grasp enzyme [Microbacter margulisiae]